DPAAILPGPSQLSFGFGSFTATFNTVGTQTLTATDISNSIINGTATNINVVGSIIGADDLVGLTTAGQLVRFSSSTPSSVTPVAGVTGLANGQSLVGIDFRPANDQLYGLALGTTGVQLYSINALTGAALAVGAPIAVSAADTSLSFGFDPV